MFDYLRDPQEIYRQSFATIEAEADLARFSDEQRTVAIRIIHACGMVQIAHQIVFAKNAIKAGIDALAAGAPVLCDSEMVKNGIIERLLPAQNPVLCSLNHPQTANHAQTLHTTRSAAAVDLWTDHLAGAVVAIGNAPTALFHLLEGIISQTLPKPALIIGMPVGFVGAKESKQALIDAGLDVPFISLAGRFGGSAVTAGTLNAIARLARTDAPTPDGT